MFLSRRPRTSSVVKVRWYVTSPGSPIEETMKLKRVYLAPYQAFYQTARRTPLVGRQLHLKAQGKSGHAEKLRNNKRRFNCLCEITNSMKNFTNVKAVW
ncbi:hypothetical protein HPB52_020417 [Rhipicephalus sanguineus]|uniref:Uncharacterized protein n=1 Tax=Rhipicephalus sanguineus TaxID=34632 RepID=A0A9D4SQY0_RHISA|nr:hypothetical protein HPB52_020417 [Rhipicephalus sanguineus]